LNGKHRRLDIELASHQAQVQNLRSKALELLQASEVRAPEILKRIQVSLNEKYKEIYFFLFKGTRR